ncbi:MAG: hypothetical protein ACI8TP_001434 [Acidimicrobiales bacterium]
MSDGSIPRSVTFACGTDVVAASLVTGDRSMQIDVLGVNTAPAAQNLLLWLHDGPATERHLVANEILAPRQYLLLWNGELSKPLNAVTEREVVAEAGRPGLSWVVVAYPVGTTPDRPGWQEATPLQLR